MPGSFFPICGIIWTEEEKIVTSKEEIKYLLLLFQNLYKNEKIELEGIRQMVDLMEVA